MTRDIATRALSDLVESFLKQSTEEWKSEISLYGSFNAWLSTRITELAVQGSSGLSVPQRLIDELRSREGFQDALDDEEIRPALLNSIVENWSTWQFRLTTKQIADRIMEELP